MRAGKDSPKETELRDEDARDAGWRVVVLTQWHLTPFAPGMEPSAVTRVRLY